MSSVASSSTHPVHSYVALGNERCHLSRPYKVLLATIAARMPVTLASEQFSRTGDKAETKINITAQALRLKFLYIRSEESSGGDVYRSVRCTPDWSDSALNGEHLWVPTSASGDLCYVGEPDCSLKFKSGKQFCQETVQTNGISKTTFQGSGGHETSTSINISACLEEVLQAVVLLAVFLLLEASLGQVILVRQAEQAFPVEVLQVEAFLVETQHARGGIASDAGIGCGVRKHGPRMKCSSCKIISHTSCISLLMDKVKFTCKPTFRDVGVRQYREQTCIHHHWVHRRTQKGRCKQCSKSFQSKLSFSSKEIVALSCTWCKMAYHNKETCFNLQKIGEECTLGSHGDIIVPPSWIVKLPRQGSFKSSLRKSPKKKTASKKKSKEKTDKDQKTFVIKPIPSATVRPVLVFINPKSGGNQGAKLLQKFQWLLNPRQVFDLTQGGPRMGLELFRKAPNLRVLACGGDGTVGWILSVLDQINITPAPPVGVLPLGTGNDLARALGWGGGYTDEPISKILSNIAESEVVNLDRWELKVEKNPSAEPNEEGKDSLPLSVINNYFSLGVDAHIALEFHEARVKNNAIQNVPPLKSTTPGPVPSEPIV
uniref:diacylglycerol kinase (ATP) n=1 Tax=Timema monikensis TaxID=170555 RepID=A0A7R9HL59_9NEOP|nr:unnamed protein product [Timema monikensis]